MVTRGVLADVAAVHGVDHFEDGHVITGDDLEAATAGRGAPVEPGDALLVRTGHMHFLRAGDKARFGNPSPGLSTRSVEWLHDHDVAAVATDTLVFEVWPPRTRPSCCRCTCCTWSTWACPRASCGRSTTWPPTARPTASTTSCCAPRRCP